MHKRINFFSLIPIFIYIVMLKRSSHESNCRKGFSMKHSIFLYMIVFVGLCFSIALNADDVARNVVVKRSITVAGTGDSQDLLRKVAAEMEHDIPLTHIVVPDSIGSSGGINALIDGKIDLARVARPLRDNEKKGLTYVPFAKSPVVFVVNPSVKGVDNLSYQQIVDIYSGRITNWSEVGGDDVKIYAIIRESGDSSLKVLQEYMPAFKDSENMNAKVMYTTPSTLEILEKYDNTIGFLPLALTIGTDLKVLAVNDVFPAVDAIKSGEYELINTFAIVHNDSVRGLAKEFLDYLFSKKAQQIFLENGTFPIQ